MCGGVARRQLSKENDDNESETDRHPINDVPEGDVVVLQRVIPMRPFANADHMNDLLDLCNEDEQQHTTPDGVASKHRNQLRQRRGERVHPSRHRFNSLLDLAASAEEEVDARHRDQPILRVVGRHGDLKALCVFTKPWRRRRLARAPRAQATDAAVLASAVLGLQLRAAVLHVDGLLQHLFDGAVPHEHPFDTLRPREALRVNGVWREWKLSPRGHAWLPQPMVPEFGVLASGELALRVGSLRDLLSEAQSADDAIVVQVVPHNGYRVRVLPEGLERP
mmetsp:Transcript_3127/g.9108  ORF Transcript_3127/g.9108 Transcript_3127/m.9108 type:complete len:279 (+) Transcript_3127:1422-2258(+)